MTREEFWQQALHRTPEQGLEGTTRKQRQDFIIQIMAYWCGEHVISLDRDLVEDFINAVHLNKGKWPKGEPKQLFTILVEKYAYAGDGGNESRRAVCNLV